MESVETVYGIYQNGQSVGFLSHDSFSEFFKDVCIDLVCAKEEREYILNLGSFSQMRMGLHYIEL